jgi:hypothetical protein
MRRTAAIITLLCLAGGGAQRASGATVLGTVIDAAMPGQPIAFINVEIRTTTSLLETVVTDIAGDFVATVPDSTDVFAVAKWEFTLRPASFYQNKVIRVIDKAPGPDSETYFQKSSMTMNSGMGIVHLDITMDQVQPVGLTQLFTEVELALDYLRLNSGSVTWQPNYNIPVHITTDGVAQFDPNDQSVHIESASFDGTGTSFDRVTLYHEVHHLTHYYLNGNMFPPTNPGCACHFVTSEENPNCAFQEGWASYVGQLTAELAGVVSQYVEYRDTAKLNWRGSTFTACGPAEDNTPAATGYDGCPSSCGFESGEDIEGAVSGAIFGWHDTFGFEDNLRIVAMHQPDDIKLFAEFFAVHAGGIDSPGAISTFSILEDHGIVYSRARFQSTPIVIDEPGDMPDPADEGSVKEIDGAVYLRGKAVVQFEPVSSTSLGVFQTIDVRDVSLEFGPATNDLNGFPGFVNSLPFVSAASQMIEFDTALSPWQDGDWDLLLIAKNFYGATDNSKPTWAGDGNTMVNTDEKYFKVVGGWYDKDRDPTTPAVDAAKEGKVVVDNTAPTVSGLQAGP